MILGLKNEEGRAMPVTVIDINDKELTVDINHPMAGKTLNFEIRIVSIE